jgi:hypothetical protein
MVTITNLNTLRNILYANGISLSCAEFDAALGFLAGSRTAAEYRELSEYERLAVDSYVAKAR